MRTSLSFKVLLRTPFKTLLTFFLLAAVSFALLSRVGEYAITAREINKAANAYRGVGSAEINTAPETHPNAPFYINTDSRVDMELSPEDRTAFNDLFHYKPLTQKQIHSILELPYILNYDMRYMTSGVSNTYFRMDDGWNFYNHTARFVLEGTLSEIQYGAYPLQTEKNHVLKFTDFTLLAGDPSWISSAHKDDEIGIISFSDKEHAGLMIGDASGGRMVTDFQDKYRYHTEYVQNLNVGDRYVIVGRAEPLEEPPKYFIGDYGTDSWCEAVQPLKDQPPNYLETEQFAPLQELIEITNTDIHTFDVVYTEDMSSIMRFAQGNMAVKTGRELTREDNLNKSKVCVVSNDFALKNDLEVGYKITLNLGTELFEQYKGLGAVASVKERYSSPSKTEELEIVGIYMDTDGNSSQSRQPNWSYSINTVFVPKSLLPLDESKLEQHPFSPGEFSFTVDSWNITDFIEKSAPKFKDMGLSLIFYDDGWPQIVDQFKLSVKLSVISITALSAAAIVAIGFIVYLFIGRKKKEFAIMRALGTTRELSARALILPLMAMTSLAVLAGSGTAWIYTSRTVAVANTTLSSLKGYAVNTSVPVSAAALCILGEMILVLLFALYGLWKIGAMPPLALLQDHPDKQKKLKKPPRNDANVTEALALPNTPVSPELNGNKKIGISVLPDIMPRLDSQRICGHVLRYTSKHMRRSVGKSILAVLLSALLMGAVGQFAVMQQSFVNLCNSVDIKAKFINGLSLSAQTRILHTGYVINPYYEYAHYVDANYCETNWAVTNDISRYTDEEAELTYAPGYDESCMKELGSVLIAGQKWLESSGLKLGDKVHVLRLGIYQYVQSTYIQNYRSEHPGDTISDEQILELNSEKIMKELEKEGSYYTIAGSVTTPSGKFDRMVFSPGTLKTTPIFGFEVPLDLAEFELAVNTQAYEFRKYAESITGGNTAAGFSDRLTFIMDTGKIDNLLNTLTLLNILFPVAATVAVIIGGIFPGLIIIQSSKEAAILRVLGTTRRRTCAILVIEQVFLCLVGLAAGILGLLFYNGASLAPITERLYLFNALYFTGCLAGTLVCSVLATRRNVLELLQTKE